MVKLGGYIYKWGEKIGLSAHFITKDKGPEIFDVSKSYPVTDESFLFDKGFSHPLMSDSDMWVSYEFLAKWVDSIGLSDHGTSVCSSWLTDEGLIWREVLRRACKEKKDDD